MSSWCNREWKKEEYDWWKHTSERRAASNGQLVTLDWHTVLSLYAINPERWSMDDIIQYRSDEDKIYTVILFYDDYRLYEAWLEKKKQEEESSRERKAIKDILKCGQRDIERFRESIKEDLKKAKDTTNEIKERLEKEKK